ncbi:unnamed protein product [Medioppia subpectinata]|uniref:Uncharacterized protein n=1 Tax=Medioppia subpectinata TaxID=1979941 RepID=A0A7R9L601_9ACAR|nr:unnamed protein product [Medioppia subpectinata]CAG2115970.1 unnamed protein product [Medioppia subpectinata]
MSVKQEVISASAPAPIGTFSQAIRHGNTVYLSGQVGWDVKTNRLVTESFEAQLDQLLRNVKSVVEAAGGSLEDIVKLNLFILDYKNFPTINKVFERYFSKPYPARTCVGVVSLPLGADIEIEGIVQLPQK